MSKKAEESSYEKTDHIFYNFPPLFKYATALCQAFLYCYFSSEFRQNENIAVYQSNAELVIIKYVVYECVYIKVNSCSGK